MPVRLREEVLSALKRFDHKVASEKHILFGLLRISTDESIPNRIIYLDEITQILKSPQPPIGESVDGYTDKAQEWLQRIKNTDNPATLFSELASECGLSISDNAAEQPSRPNSNFATQDKPAESKALSSGVAKELSEMSIEESLEELNQLIGLDSVKSQINTLVATHKVNAARKEKGLPEIPQSLHLIFSGDPGTGKTTVARIVSQIYKSLKILPAGHLVEVGRADMVAGFVGQTAIKVQEVAESASGGVLFIDEAYSLAFDSGAGFGSEAISTLLQHMENNRGKLAVIAAGYTDQMKDFVASNPGLRSRFQTFIDFPNYSADELLEIFKKFAKDYHLIITPEVEQKLKEHFSRGNFGGESGNARYVRNLFEKMFSNLAHRAHEDGKIEDHELEQFSIEDIPSEPIKGMSTGNKIGFN